MPCRYLNYRYWEHYVMHACRHRALLPLLVFGKNQMNTFINPTWEYNRFQNRKKEEVNSSMENGYRKSYLGKHD